MSENKRWSDMTVEERVRITLANQRKWVERIDPNDQFLTHHNYIHDPVNYNIVDLQRHFLRVLEMIVEKPKAQPPVPPDACPVCHGIGYDSSGQRCEECQNPSF